MIIGIGLWQFKGLAALTVGIDMGEERTGIAAIIAATTEYHPPAIARPGMITLRLRRINFVHSADLTAGEIQQIEVGLAMPDVKDAIMPHGEHEETSVGRHTRKSGAHIEAVSLKHQFTWSELIGIGIE